MIRESVDRRAFLASAGVVGALAAIKEEHKLEGGEVLRLEPGDFIVLRTSEPLSYDAAVKLKARAELALGVKVVVLAGDLSMSVVRPA